jgi:hypothetical protein
MKISIVVALAFTGLSSFALSGAPAFAQQVVKDFSWGEMRDQIVKAGAAITKEGVSGDQRYMSGKDDTGMSFGVYGFECDSAEPTQRCRGADMIASFTLKDASKGDTVLNMLDYAAVSDYRDDEGHVKISRYMIFDGGVTQENLQTNITVFLNLANQAWDKLDDAGLLK